MEKITEYLYWIDVNYATFGVVTDGAGVIVETAPIAKWTLGKHISYVRDYYVNKKNANFVYCE